MNLDWSKFFTTVFEPLVEFLKKEGLWDGLSKILYFLYDIFKTLFSWIDSNIMTQNIWDFLLSFLKFIVELIVVIFNVFVNIFHWIEGVIK